MKTNRTIYTTDPEHACVIGIRGGKICFTPMKGLEAEVDTKSRRSNSTWWLDVNNYTRMLAKYDYRDEDDIDDDISTRS
jgi:6-phosphofructokinase 1